MYLAMPTVTRSELFQKAADAMPPISVIRAMILLSQYRMSLVELWHILATYHQLIGHPESSFFLGNNDQIVDEARLGSLEKKKRQDDYLKNIKTVMREIEEAIRLEPKQVGHIENQYTKCMLAYQHEAHMPAETKKVDFPPPQKRKSVSPPPQPKKQAPQLLGELVDLGIGSKPICQAFIEKAKFGFADQRVMCLADLGKYEWEDVNAMLRLIGLKGNQLSKVLGAVFKA
jgi:hypothetical protein